MPPVNVHGPSPMGPSPMGPSPMGTRSGAMIDECHLKSPTAIRQSIFAERASSPQPPGAIRLDLDSLLRYPAKTSLIFHFRRNRDVLAMRMFQCIVLFLAPTIAAPLAHAAETLATVNGTRITDADVEFEIISRNIDREKVTPETRRRLLEELIDLELIVQYLRKQKVRVDNSQIVAQIKRLEEIIEEHGEDPDEVLKNLGFNKGKLRKRLVDYAMWDNFFDSQVDAKALKQYFENHKEQFDGTEVRGSQIYLKLPENPTEKDIAAAKAKLAEYKKQIEAGEITFAEAAKKWSQAPSAKNGGDLGFSMYRGKNPEVLTRVLFDLEKGKVSEPFRTPFGMHLMTVTDRVPGTFQLEDVRGIVRNRLRKQMWDKFAETRRKSARVQYAK